MDTTFGLLLLIASLVIPFTPTIVACVRRHRNRLPIIFLNICVSVVGIPIMIFVPISILVLFPVWFFALVWAMTANFETEPRNPRQPSPLLGSSETRPWSPGRPRGFRQSHWDKLKAKADAERAHRTGLQAVHDAVTR